MGRLRGVFWLSSGMIVAVLAGFVAFVTLARAQAQSLDQEGAVPEVMVVVASTEIRIREPLSSQDLQLKEMRVSSVPEGAARRIEDVAGQLTLVDLYPGEIILSQRLLDPNVAAGDGRAALALAQDEILMAFPRDDLMGQIDLLRPGDQVDLLFTLMVPVDPEVVGPVQNSGDTGAFFGGNIVEDTDTQVTFGLLQNMVISAVVGGPAPVTDGSVQGNDTGPSEEALLLTLSSQDALVLKFVKDAGGIVDVVLRAPGADRQYDMQPVDLDYLIDRYRIPIR